jgi:hypothetical protein
VIERDIQDSMGRPNSSSHLYTLDAFISMFEFFVKTVRDGPPSPQYDVLMEVSAEVERVKGQLQTVPENVVSLENRLYFVEQDLRNLNQQY